MAKTHTHHDRPWKFKGLSAKLDFPVEIPRTSVAAYYKQVRQAGHRKLLGGRVSARFSRALAWSEWTISLACKLIGDVAKWRRDVAQTATSEQIDGQPAVTSLAGQTKCSHPSVLVDRSRGHWSQGRALVFFLPVNSSGFEVRSASCAHRSASYSMRHASMMPA